MRQAKNPKKPLDLNSTEKGYILYGAEFPTLALRLHEFGRGRRGGAHRRTHCAYALADRALNVPFRTLEVALPHRLRDRLEVAGLAVGLGAEAVPEGVGHHRFQVRESRCLDRVVEHTRRRRGGERAPALQLLQHFQRGCGAGIRLEILGARLAAPRPLPDTSGRARV